MNLASDRSVRLNDVLHQMGELLGVGVHPVYEPPRSGDVRDSLADISLAREILGWEPTVSFADGLRYTVEAFREATRPGTTHTVVPNDDVALPVRTG